MDVLGADSWRSDDARPGGRAAFTMCSSIDTRGLRLLAIRGMLARFVPDCLIGPALAHDNVAHPLEEVRATVASALSSMEKGGGRRLDDLLLHMTRWRHAVPALGVPRQERTTGTHRATMHMRTGRNEHRVCAWRPGALLTSGGARSASTQQLFSREEHLGEARAGGGQRDR
eukprot:scaffold110534_cov34-Tisochrysis_lutea.AAC.2